MFRFDSKNVLMAMAIGGLLMASGPAFASSCMYSSRPHMVVPPNAALIHAALPNIPKGGASASWTDANGKQHTATKKPGGPTVIDGKPVASKTPKGGAYASWTNSDGTQGWARMDANGNTQFGPTGPMH